MIRLCRYLGIAAIVLALGWAALAAVRSAREETARRAPLRSGPEVEPPRPPSRPVSAGCSASRCHGAEIPADAEEQPKNAWRWSSTMWSMSDRHRQAYEVLKGPLSQAIGKHLGGPEPTENPRCLVCHSDPALSNLPAELSVVQARSEGIGCRACHGDPAKWFEAHLNWGPGDDREAVYRKYGMRWMNDFTSRATLCVGCHVGAPPAEGGILAKDVDHDLIAAGHPRLNFDFATYQRMMPPHWSEKDRTGKNPLPANPAVKAWSVGRLAEMKAALDLLEYRSDPAKAHPWPEFTEFNCYDCHHDLRDGGRGADGKGLEKGPDSAGRKRGRFGWYRAGELDLLAPSDSTTEFLSAMQTPSPDEEHVHQLVPDVLKTLKAPPDSPTELLKWIAADEAKFPRPNWDQASWMYQAMVAIEVDRRNQSKGKPDDLDAEFSRVRDKLLLNPPSDAKRWNSPHSFDPLAARKLLVDLSKRLR
jgi:Cytochrome c554 and c-prime